MDSTPPENKYKPIFTDEEAKHRDQEHRAAVGGLIDRTIGTKGYDPTPGTERIPNFAPAKDSPVQNNPETKGRGEKGKTLRRLQGFGAVREAMYEFLVKTGLKKPSELVETVDSGIPLALKGHRITEMHGEDHEVVLKKGG